ncbi:hypothetical protein [Flavobacterium dankookense]|uniref:Uncharacterized protein n=1 Tax=Flavobacterium dankookense TaxID=706186 RepID=A0A4R6QGG9_9FLAO|nr:hypothetical protein [Flavobacterium dankookense]TDP61146.1 hypothetical protein BC748_0759 [Flavobacterium dankookense]
MEKEYVIVVVADPFFQKKRIDELIKWVMPVSVLFEVGSLEEYINLTRIVNVDVVMLIDTKYQSGIVEKKVTNTMDTKYLVFAKKTKEILFRPATYFINQNESDKNILNFIKGLLFKLEPKIKVA